MACALTCANLECSIKPDTRCQCWQPDRPQVVCRGLHLSAIPTLDSDMAEVHTLILSRNQIKEVGENTFLNVTSLRRLLLDHNNITELSAFSFNGPHNSLEVLDMSHNMLSIISISLLSLRRLRVLNLGHNHLESIRYADISNLPRLHTLFLDNNDHSPMLSFDRRALDGCSSLRSLSLSIKQLSGLTRVYTNNLQSITHLMITDSYIGRTDLRSNLLLNTPSLTHLELTRCGLSSSVNQMEGFPSFNLANLEYLSLSENSLRLNWVEQRVLAPLEHLTVLDLSFNTIKVVQGDTKAFTKMGANLREISLKSNRITEFNLKALSTARNLEVLDLRMNKLQDLQLENRWEWDSFHEW